jgi:hypothetical protein
MRRQKGKTTPMARMTLFIVFSSLRFLIVHCWLYQNKVGQMSQLVNRVGRSPTTSGPPLETDMPGAVGMSQLSHSCAGAPFGRAYMS